MTIKEVEAVSWLHLNELLFEDSWHNNIKRHRSNFSYRGVEDKRYELSTSLLRMGTKKTDPYHGLKLEGSMLRSFQKYAYTSETDNYSFWYWMTLAQHHGLPTRLMDWTSSPLVALHFVTRDMGKYDKDGAVWCANVAETRDQLPDSFWDILKRDYAFLFSTEMLTELATNLDDFSSLGSNHNFLVFFEPPSLDQRIVNQSSLFSVMPDARVNVDDWLDLHTAEHRKIIIPKELKWEIRNKLDQMNITERVLFPGLDGLSEWLKRYYCHYPKGATNTEGRVFPP